MDTLKRKTTALFRFLKQLNLFDTYSTNQKQIKREIITTRIYLILLPTVLTILIIYSAQKQLFHTIQINNPSLDTYQQLLHTYPDTLVCPCSQLSIPYSTFVTLIPHLDPVCSSDFISDQWLDYLYYDDASFYVPYDIRSVGNAQFQLLRTLCQSSFQAINNTFKSTFASAILVSSRGILLNPELVHEQMEAFTNEFIINIGSEQRRRRSLFSSFFDRNFLVSGLRTSAIPFIDTASNLKMRGTLYVQNLDEATILDSNCTCDETYTCAGTLGIFNSSLYESDILKQEDVSQARQSFLEVVEGFRSGCLPLNSLLLSTLQCYHNQSCFNSIGTYLGTLNSSFTILTRNNLNQSTPTSALVHELMVEEWSKEMNYSQYFAACRPLSCSYNYTQNFDILYIITTLIGLLGGLIAILRIICPQITNGFYLIQQYILRKKAKNSIKPMISGRKDLMEYSEG